MTAAALFYLAVGVFVVIYFITGRKDGDSAKVVVKAAGPPAAAVSILRGAAREMGADIYGTEDAVEDDSQENITLIVHGKGNGGIWAVQVNIRKAWRGSVIELVAQGLSEDLYNTVRDRRDELARRLRE